MIMTVTLNAAIDSTWKIDDFRMGVIQRAPAKEPVRAAGGKGLNVARIINRLQEDVLATGFVGGHTGELIKSKLEERGIEYQFVYIDGESRECLIFIDPVNRTETVVNGYGPDISQEKINEFLKFFRDLAPQCEIICISGSLPGGVPSDIYAQLITIAHKKHIPVILDASEEALIEGVRAKPFMIKPNIKEVQAVLNNFSLKSDEDIVKAGRHFIKKGVKVAVISGGREGSIVVTDEYAYKIISPRVKTLNTVASGDAFVGGFSVAISKGNSILDAVRLGTAAGAANAENLTACDIDIDRIYELKEEVKICPLM